MKPTVGIEIPEAVGSRVCVAADDGELLFEKIATAIEDGSKVRLSFKNVDTVTSAFLNTAIGQLFGSFSGEQIASLLEFSEVDEEDLFLLKRVLERARAYFSEPERLERLRREISGEGDDDDTEIDSEI